MSNPDQKMSKKKKPLSSHLDGSPAKLTFSAKVADIMPYMGASILQDKFFYAVYTRNVPEIKRCLSKGVDTNVLNRDFGVAPIHILAERNDSILGYSVLLNRQVDLDAKTVHSYSALHLTSYFNCKKFAALLLNNGANPDIRDRFGRTPLHLAVEREYDGMVLTLLKKKAAVNVMDYYENTPLSYSVLRVRNLPITKILLDNGADMNFEEERSLHLFFELILSCHCLDDIDFVVAFLKNGFDINTREEASGRNCLHFAAVTGYVEVAIVLVEHGADPFSMDHMNRTAVAAAKQHGHYILADYLRKGYRPPHVLKTLPFLYLWSNKVKSRIAKKQAEEELDEERQIKFRSKSKISF